MPNEVWQLALLAGGFVLLSKTKDPQKRKTRFLLWSPIPLVWIAMVVLTKWKPAFWESDQAALPAILMIVAMLVYAVCAVRVERRLK